MSNILKTISNILVKVQTAILLSLVYYLIIMPLGLIKQLLGKHQTNQTSSYWNQIPSYSSAIKNFFQQF